jgi:hypothetical protein
LLQKAYSANAEGFYVYAPKQKGNVKEQLKYIGRYIRRPAIALHRIEEYDGELKVRYAVDGMARRYLTREIEHGKVKEEKTQEARRNHRISISSSETQGQLRLFGVQ